MKVLNYCSKCHENRKFELRGSFIDLKKSIKGIFVCPVCKDKIILEFFKHRQFIEADLVLLFCLLGNNTPVLLLEYFSATDFLSKVIQQRPRAIIRIFFLPQIFYQKFFNIQSEHIGLILALIIILLNEFASKVLSKCHVKFCTYVRDVNCCEQTTYNVLS